MAGLDEAFALLNKTKGLIRQTEARNAALTYAGGQAGAKAEEIVGSYPIASGNALPLFYDRVDSQGRPYKSKFKSMRQQRFVMRLAAKGKIPYRRTGRLGASITHVVEVYPNGVLVNVGTNTPYARYVIGQDGQQSHYHTGTWIQLRQTLMDNRAEIVNVFANALIWYIRGYLKKK